jgi:hypothetical protein
MVVAGSDALRSWEGLVPIPVSIGFGMDKGGGAAVEVTRWTSCGMNPTRYPG